MSIIYNEKPNIAICPSKNTGISLWSGSSSGSSTDASGTRASNDWPYAQITAYPTRDGTTYVLATWTIEELNVRSVDKVMLYYTTTPYNNLSVNDYWEYGDDNPMSDSMSDVTMYNLTNRLSDGDIYETWWSRTGYYIVIGLQFVDNSGNRYFMWNNAMNGTPTSSNYITSSAPTITYNSTTGALSVSKLCSGRRILEFRRTDIPYGGSTGITDEATLNEMFYTSLMDMEYRPAVYKGYYYLSNSHVLNRWNRGSYTIGVNFQSTINQSRINSAINNAISQVNSVMNEFGVSFTRSGTSGDITITVDTEYNLYGIDISDAAYLYGGTWSIDSLSGGYIKKASIKLACDFAENGARFSSYETVAFEELLQTMGAGKDQVEYVTGTIHTDFNYYNKQSTMYTRDANILRLIYSSYVNVNDAYYEVCKKLNVPKGALSLSSSSNDQVVTINAASFLDRGGTYQVRAFIVNASGNVSGTSNWITITVPLIVIDKWDWNTTNTPGNRATAAQTRRFYGVLRGNYYPEDGFSYKVWNDLVDKAYEVVDAAGYSWVNYKGLGRNGCYVSSGDYMSAAKYNEVRYNLGSIISTSQSGYPNVVVSNGDEIFGWHIYRLAEVINEIIDTI